MASIRVLVLQCFLRESGPGRLEAGLPIHKLSGQFPVASILFLL
jgi:hypothetical protein